MPEFIESEIARGPCDVVRETADNAIVSRSTPHATRPPSPLSSLDSLLIRPGTIDDLPFIDKLQKKQSKQVGFFPTQALEGKIKLGHVLVAEMQFGVESLEFGVGAANELPSTPNAKLQTSNVPAAAGYLIGNDQYFKRDDVGCIFQINVVPEYRRSLVAAMLLQAQFERSSWGCKLYCCWCAQNIEANRFWEAMGFVPLAFRSGGKVGRWRSAVGREDRAGSALPTADRGLSTTRIHIFWQKRIRRGDVTTPWWFPCKTGGGSLREDRIVLPIPPGTRWDETMPVVLPEQTVERGQTSASSVESGSVASDFANRTRADRSSLATTRLSSPKSRHSSPTTAEPRPAIRMGGMWSATPTRAKKKKRRVVHDPVLVQRARELRDRWLEQVNQTPLIAHAKYDVSRLLDEHAGEITDPTRLLAA